MSEILLDVQHLSHVFKLSKHTAIKAVDDVSFQMKKGEIFGLVGELCSLRGIHPCYRNVYHSDDERFCPLCRICRYA